MRILIISEYIAPLQAIASVRWSKIAKYIKQAHPEVKITVLTTRKEYDTEGSLKKDALLERDMAAFDQYWEIPKSAALSLYEKLKERNKSLTRGSEQETLQDLQEGMGPRAKRELVLAAHDLKQRLFCQAAQQFLKGRELDFDVIVSTYGPAWTHLVAKGIKRRAPAAFWIADFRDPYAKETDEAWAFRRHAGFLKRHCACADVITRVTDTLYLNAPETVAVKTIYNGYDPQEARPPLPPDAFWIVYTGALYGRRRDIGIACKAIKELTDSGQIEKAKVVYAGPDGTLARQLAKRYLAEEYLQDKGALTRTEAMELQQKAAVLLQLNWNTDQEQCQWSGKMYEYMMMRKPIAFLVTGDRPYSYPSRYMERLGGVCYEQCRAEETYPLLKQYILDKYREWTRTGNVTIQQDRAYAEQFAYPQIAEQVWRLIPQTHKDRENRRVGSPQRDAAERS